MLLKCMLSASIDRLVLFIHRGRNYPSTLNWIYPLDIVSHWESDAFRAIKFILSLGPVTGEIIASCLAWLIMLSVCNIDTCFMRRKSSTEALKGNKVSFVFLKYTYYRWWKHCYLLALQIICVMWFGFLYKVYSLVLFSPKEGKCRVLSVNRLQGMLSD